MTKAEERHRMMIESHAQAQDRANREQAPMTIYHVAHDQYGRDAVYYVRSESEGAPDEENFITVARVEPEA